MGRKLMQNEKVGNSLRKNNPASTDTFLQCSLCGHVWSSREEFISDPQMTLLGYQVNFTDLNYGLFLFTHTCGTTVSLTVDAFKDFYDGPIFSERATGTEACPGFCLIERELRLCPTRCECAYVREILQILRAWPKESGVTELR